jgi:hypothetical protein
MTISEIQIIIITTIITTIITITTIIIIPSKSPGVASRPSRIS